MVTIYIDNITVKIQRNTTVLQACESIGIDIPRFCFHERLLIAGNCRMCLVELEKSPKPVASCALPVSEGMRVFTQSPLVKKAQEGVLEFLLLNHPLDCPICDQGGECDLQDQVMLFGSDSSRFYNLTKRGVEDKNCGPLIKTIMTRCIHCTRCVRFLSEIAGMPELGTLGRGTHTQIGTYLDKTLSSELSGNLIDLCPVGALTSKPYVFKARPWELESTVSVDISDSCGSNIIINSKGKKIMRILPYLNENINEEWISDKTRFSFDGLFSIKRLRIPLFMDHALRHFESLSWEKSFRIFLLSIYKDIYNLDNRLNIIFGKDSDVESILILKYLFNKLNCFSLYSDNNFCNNASDLFYKFNIKMKDINNNDLCILVNSNTRFEASMLNLHLRKNFNLGSLDVAYFGPSMNLTFNTTHLGFNSNAFLELLKGKHFFSKRLKKAKNPIFIIGSNTFSNNELLYIQDILSTHLNFSNNCINILNLDGSGTGLRDIGIKSLKNLNFLKKSYISYLYINTDLKNKQILSLFNKNNFNLYCGSFAVKEVNYFDLVLPGKSFVEKEVSFMNLEGLLQRTNKSISVTGNIRDEWKIFLAFFEFLIKNSLYSRILRKDISNSDNLFSFHKFFNKEFPFLLLKGYNNSIILKIRNINFLFPLFSNLFYKNNILNFYKTNAITSFSSIMTQCYNNMQKLNFK